MFQTEKGKIMLNRLFCCLAALFLFCGTAVSAEKSTAKKSKVSKKERKAAQKSEKQAPAEQAGEIKDLPPRAPNWKGGPNRTWEINFNDAIKKAKAENKKLFVLRSGSDWCPLCKKLKSAVLGNSLFRKIADQAFVLVFIDYPHHIKLPPTQVQHNNIISKKFQFGPGFPSALVIDPATLKVEEKLPGYQPAKKYVQKLQRFAKVPPKKAKKK